MSYGFHIYNLRQNFWREKLNNWFLWMNTVSFYLEVPPYDVSPKTWICQWPIEGKPFLFETSQKDHNHNFSLQFDRSLVILAPSLPRYERTLTCVTLNWYSETVVSLLKREQLNMNKIYFHSPFATPFSNMFVPIEENLSHYFEWGNITFSYKPIPARVGEVVSFYYSERAA